MIKLLFTLIAAAFVIWALVDIFRKPITNNRKVMWFVLVILLPIAGSVAYYFMEHKK